MSRTSEECVNDSFYVPRYTRQLFWSASTRLITTYTMTFKTYTDFIRKLYSAQQQLTGTKAECHLEPLQCLEGAAAARLFVARDVAIASCMSAFTRVGSEVCGGYQINEGVD